MSKGKGSSEWLIIVLALLFVLSFIAYRERGAIYNELNKLKLIPTPERFTELYFQNPSSLPRETIKDQSMSFAFTIHNLEGVTTAYPYEIYFEYPDGSEVILETSTVILANNASTTIPVTHTFQASNLTGEVIVNLTSLNQQIDFLLPDSN